MDTKVDLCVPFPLAPKGKHFYLRYGRAGATNLNNSFRCNYCQAYVHTIPELSGVRNRNHCPYCLWSKHLDLIEAGDRLAACKGTMQPIGLTMKHVRDKYGITRAGELMLIHRCIECGRTSINRIAADDAEDRIMAILRTSCDLEVGLRQYLSSTGIHLLQTEDEKIVESQLFGQQIHQEVI